MCHKKVMRKRRSSDHLLEEPPRKRISPGGNVLPVRITPDEILTDLTGKQWRLGKTVGYGGFGEIYLASNNIKEPVKNNAPFVVKVESHSSGPLFVEINCLLRIAKSDMIKEWEKNHGVDFLGLPRYVASGSHTVDKNKIRFLVVPRYEQDLEKIFLAKHKKLNLKTVMLICSQILDILEYIHSKGYVHCDIKASNILHSLQKSKSPSKITVPKPLFRGCNPFRNCRNKIVRERKHAKNLRQQQSINYSENDFFEYYLLETLDDNIEILDKEISVNREAVLNKQATTNQIILIDYGLATKYRQTDGRHKQYINDERKAHAGTILFCSIDAHLGASSRRSDLESLGYNMIYWLTSNLPWSDDINNPETVQDKKEKCFNNLETFLKSCFPEYPTVLYEYFKYVKSLSFESQPDYAYCRKLLNTALNDYGYKNDGRLDFDNLEGWGQKPTKPKKKSENINRRKMQKSSRPPLTSNIMLEKPILRKNHNNKKGKKKLNWSKILSDPEEILRQKVAKTRERKLTDSSDSSFAGNSLHNLDIWTLNPTYAMLDVFQKSRDKNANFNGIQNTKRKSSDGLTLKHCDGFTPAMDLVFAKMQRNRLVELENKTEVNFSNVYLKRTRSVKLNEKKKAKSSITKDVGRRKSKPVRILRGYGLRG